MPPTVTTTEQAPAEPTSPRPARRLVWAEEAAAADAADAARAARQGAAVQHENPNPEVRALPSFDLGTPDGLAEARRAFEAAKTELDKAAESLVWAQKEHSSSPTRANLPILRDAEARLVKAEEMAASTAEYLLRKAAAHLDAGFERLSGVPAEWQARQEDLRRQRDALEVRITNMDAALMELTGRFDGLRNRRASVHARLRRLAAGEPIASLGDLADL